MPFHAPDQNYRTSDSLGSRLLDLSTLKSRDNLDRISLRVLRRMTERLRRLGGHVTPNLNSFCVRLVCAQSEKGVIRILRDVKLNTASLE